MSNTSDAINPPYYKDSKFECIDVIEDWRLNFHLGNVVKYVCRHGKKHADSKKQLEDLRKARWYLDRYIEKLACAGGLLGKV